MQHRVDRSTDRWAKVPTGSTLSGRPRDSQSRAQAGESSIAAERAGFGMDVPARYESGSRTRRRCCRGGWGLGWRWIVADPSGGVPGVPARLFGPGSAGTYQDRACREQPSRVPLHTPTAGKVLLAIALNPCIALIPAVVRQQRPSQRLCASTSGVSLARMPWDSHGARGSTRWFAPTALQST